PAAARLGVVQLALGLAQDAGDRGLGAARTLEDRLALAAAARRLAVALQLGQLLHQLRLVLVGERRDLAVRRVPLVVRRGGFVPGTIVLEQVVFLRARLAVLSQQRVGGFLGLGVGGEGGHGGGEAVLFGLLHLLG